MARVFVVLWSGDGQDPAEVDAVFDRRKDAEAHAEALNVASQGYSVHEREVRQ